MHGKKAHKWINESDDRRIYANTYFILYNAVVAIATIENNTVLCAMNAKMRDSFEMMAEIAMRFKNKSA
jgi:hypothetical protein